MTGRAGESCAIKAGENATRSTKLQSVGKKRFPKKRKVVVIRQRGKIPKWNGFKFETKSKRGADSSGSGTGSVLGIKKKKHRLTSQGASCTTGGGTLDRKLGERGGGRRG